MVSTDVIKLMIPEYKTNIGLPHVLDCPVRLQTLKKQYKDIYFQF